LARKKTISSNVPHPHRLRGKEKEGFHVAKADGFEQPSASVLRITSS
jgi:hypothetical protein